MEAVTVAPTLPAGARPIGFAHPSAVYLTGEESLRVSALGNAAGLSVAVAARTLTPDQVIHPTTFTAPVSSNRTLTATTAPLSEGWLMGVSVRVSGGPPPFGAVWVLLELVRGSGSAAIVLQSLVSGFVTANVPLIWPGSPSVQPIDGAGCLRSITGTTPGAGANISETVPVGARWELLAFTATLTTDVNVANRIVALTLDDGATVFFRYVSSANQAASGTIVYQWAEGLMTPYITQISGFLFGLPINNRLGPGFRLRTTTSGIQVGDQFSAVQYLVRETFDL